MLFQASTLAVTVLASLSAVQGLTIRQTNSTSSNSSSSSTSSSSTGNALATCLPPPTLNAQYASFSGGYANVCCVGTTSACFVRQQSTIATADQCDIPSCPDLRSGNAASMKGFEALDGGAPTGGKLAGNSSVDSDGETGAFPNASVVDIGDTSPAPAPPSANLALCFTAIFGATAIALAAL